ncbi:MAG: hypothetical protein PHV59_08100 [Victivallales bacterium]|nr:hypothetical protein [Victivallales bacterium]
MRTIIWKLNTGSHPLQETLEEKRKRGLEYIEKLKADDEKVLEVIEENNQLRIILE